MARAPALLALGVLALPLVLGACQPRGGDATAALPTDTAAESQLRAIPLGPAPGGGSDLGTQIRNPYEGDAAAVAQGKQLFLSMNCAYCHMFEGAGLMGPALNGHGWRYGGTPAQIYNSIHDGRPQGMPAWGTRLPADQIWKLVAYVESLGGALPPATPAMAGIAGSPPSTTGAQPEGEVQTDTAQASLTASNKSQQGGRP